MLAVLHNYCQFAASIIDRINPEGTSLVDAPRIQSDAALLSQGSILLGAHYGDWALIAKRIKPLLSGTLGLVMDPAVTPQFFLEMEQQFNGQLRIIDSRQGPLGFALSIKDLLDDQGHVAFLADRASKDKPNEALTCDFLGVKAWWPKAPFEISSRLQVPVNFVVAVKKSLRPSAPYQVEFVELWNGRDKIGSDELLRRYVKALEEKVVLAPQHWFNFFPFW